MPARSARLPHQIGAEEIHVLRFPVFIELERDARTTAKIAVAALEVGRVQRIEQARNNMLPRR